MFTSRSNAATKASTSPDAPRATRKTRRRVECYCGGYEECALFLLMSPTQREACTIDKRMNAQRMWKNGM